MFRWHVPCTNFARRALLAGRRDAVVSNRCSRTLAISSGYPRRWSAGVCGAAALIAAATLATLSMPAQAENAEISLRRAAERTTFSNEEIRDGFFKTAFHAELQFDQKADRIRKFGEPVRIFIANRGAPDRRADIAAVINDIRARVDHLDLAVTDNGQAAHFVVTLVQRRELMQTIRSRYGAERAEKIQHALAPECLSGIG